MKKWFWLIVIVVITITAFFWYNRFIPLKSAYFILESWDYSKTFLVAGRIELSKMMEPSLSLPGIIQAIFVEESEWVKEGDLLLSLDDSWEKNNSS